MVMRLGPAARGAALPQATAQAALASASRRKLIDGPFGQAGGEKLPVSIRAVERAVTSSSHCITNHATRQGRAMFFIILLVTESPICVEIEDGYGREAVRAAVLRSCGVGRRCRVG